MTNATNVIDELDAIIPASTPEGVRADTYLPATRGAAVKPMIKAPMLPWQGISIGALRHILRNPAAYVAAAKEAAKQSAAPGELERLQKVNANRAAVKAAKNGKSAAPTAAQAAAKAKAAADLAADLDALQV